MMELGCEERDTGISNSDKRPWMTWSMRVKPINKDKDAAAKSKNKKLPIKSKPLRLSGYQFFMKAKCSSVTDKAEKGKFCQLFLQQWRSMSQVEKKAWSDVANANRNSTKIIDSSKMASETPTKKSKHKGKNTKVLETFVKDFFRTKKFWQSKSKLAVQKRSEPQDQRSESSSKLLSQLFRRECSVILRQLDHQRR